MLIKKKKKYYNRTISFSQQQKNKKRRQIVLLFLSIFILLSAGSLTAIFIGYKNYSRKVVETAMKPVNEKGIEQEEEQVNKPASTLLSNDSKRKKLLQTAEQMVVQYDYEGAINLLKQEYGYERYEDVLELISKLKMEQLQLVEWDIQKTTHVFFHSLVADNKKAFDGDDREHGYDMYMTTISEFNKMMESMYKRGYVLVTPHQIAAMEDNGAGKKIMTDKKILLPKGKKAFILSIDDVSYYQYMNGDGFASRLVIDANGKPTNEMLMDDGSISTGDYDVPPLLERFIEKHPDFSYKNAKGVIALTGYDGVLGYRTSASQHRDNNKFVSEHPGYNYEKECEDAKKVVEGMKACGWLFASHSYSHNNIGQQSTGDKKPLSYKAFKHDTDMWEKEVRPIVGDTDIIIFPQGTHLNEEGRPDWKPYKKNNTHYKYLKKQGFNYYFGVGGYQPWVQLKKDYFRQDRINFDGVEMRNAPKLLKQFFDPQKVYDNDRPTKLK